MNWQKETVEKLVGPLPLREAAKERLREELWGHLASLYEEELAGGVDAETARRAACTQLGDRDTLAREIGAGACFGERIEVYLMRYLTQTGFDRILAVRTAARAACGTSLTLLAVALATRGLPGMTPATALVAWISETMLVAVAAAAAVIVIGEIHARSGARGLDAGAALHGWVRGLAASIAVCFLVALAAWLAGYAAMLAVCVSFDRWDLLYVFWVFGRGVLLTATVFLALLSPALAWGFVWRERRARRLPAWPYSA